MTDKLRAAHELQKAVTEIASGDDWKRMLQVVSNFHRYSFNNRLMIFLEASRRDPGGRVQPVEVAGTLRQEGCYARIADRTVVRVLRDDDRLQTNRPSNANATMLSARRQVARKHIFEALVDRLDEGVS